MLNIDFYIHPNNYTVDFWICLLYYKTMQNNSSGYTKGKPKKTSQGKNKSRIKMSSMNKHKKRSYKSYAGQGK